MCTRHHKPGSVIQFRSTKVTIFYSLCLYFTEMPQVKQLGKLSLKYYLHLRGSLNVDLEKLKAKVKSFLFCKR